MRGCPDRDGSVVAQFACVLLALGVVLPATGCCLFGPSPPPPPLSSDQVVAALRADSERFRTVTDNNITLLITETADGRTHRLPRFGGNLGFDREKPALYLLAEKLGQTAFWLRARGMHFWLALPRTQEVVTGGPVAYAKLPEFLRPDEVRGFFSGPDWLGLTWPSTRMAVEQDDYRFDVYVVGTLRRQVFVDRRKVVVTAMRSYDALGRTVTEVRLSKHRPADGLLFPRRLTIERPPLGVTLELRLGNPKINPDIRPEAFEPAERPGWTHVNLDVRPRSAVRAFRAD